MITLQESDHVSHQFHRYRSPVSSEIFFKQVFGGCEFVFAIFVAFPIMKCNPKLHLKYRSNNNDTTAIMKIMALSAPTNKNFYITTTTTTTIKNKNYITTTTTTTTTDNTNNDDDDVIKEYLHLLFLMKE